MAPASLVSGEWGDFAVVRVLVLFLALLGGAGAARALTFTEAPGGGSVFTEAPVGSDYRFMLLSPDPKDQAGRASVSATADAAYRVTFSWLYSGAPGDFGAHGVGSFGYRLDGTDVALIDPAGTFDQDGAASFLVARGSSFGWYLDYQPAGGVPSDLARVSANIAPVPLPAGLLLVGTGLAALFGLGRRRRA